MVDQQRINKKRNEKCGIHINSEIGQVGKINLFFFLQITTQIIAKVITSDKLLDLRGAAYMQLLLKARATTSPHQIPVSKVLFLAESATTSHPAYIILCR